MGTANLVDLGQLECEWEQSNLFTSTCRFITKHRHQKANSAFWGVRAIVV